MSLRELCKNFESMARMERFGRMMEAHLSNEYSASNEGGHVAETYAAEEASKYKRLEIPIFSGEDPNGCIFITERYFAVNGIAELENISAMIFFDMGGADLVLGIDWLKSLGEVWMDWGQLTMKIKTNKGEKCLNGDPSLSKTIISPKAMLKTLQGGYKGYCIEFGEMRLTHDPKPLLPPEIEKLIEEFPEVTKTKGKLPSRHTQDHSIIIKPGEQSPNIPHIVIPISKRPRSRD